MPNTLFKPFQLGDLILANRIVMAPMTRNRADEFGVPTASMAIHYGQRATAGLIIAESAPVSGTGVGYPLTPGIYTEAQMMGWRAVVNAVHANGGRIFLQLQHCGRISHPSLQPDAALPLAPSALRPVGQAVTYTGMQDFVTPRALEESEIAGVVDMFLQAAKLARQAGFDGIEVHGANGYLIDQFLRDGSNHRTDAYGGNPQGRMRLLNEILDAVCTVWSSERVGVRLSPENSFNSMSDSNPQMHFEYVAAQLRPRRLAYLHVLEGDMLSGARTLDYQALRTQFGGAYIASNGYDQARACAAIDSDAADLVAFGIPFLANPDLVRRYREALPLNSADAASFYQGGDVGYLDYPFHTAEPQPA